jgi:hypothetical protein
MPSVEEVIADAIRRRMVVTATYQNYERIMCPHVVGRKKGVLNALFFQFAGSSRTGLPSGAQWRCVHVNELSDVSASPGRWHTGPDYAKPQTCVDQIIEEVS